jgi:hypothetical protein
MSKPGDVTMFSFSDIEEQESEFYDYSHDDEDAPIEYGSYIQVELANEEKNTKTFKMKWIEKLTYRGEFERKTILYGTFTIKRHQLGWKVDGRVFRHEALAIKHAMRLVYNRHKNME